MKYSTRSVLYVRTEMYILYAKHKHATGSKPRTIYLANVPELHTSNYINIKTLSLIAHKTSRPIYELSCVFTMPYLSLL